MKSSTTIKAVLLLLAGVVTQQASAGIVYGDNAGTDLFNAISLNNSQSAFDDFTLSAPATVTSFTIWAVMDPGVDVSINAGTFQMNYLITGDTAGVVDFTKLVTISSSTTASAVANGQTWVIIPGVLELPVYEVTYSLSSPLFFNAGETFWLGLTTPEVGNISWMSHSPVSGTIAQADAAATGTLQPLPYDLAFVLNDASDIPTPAPLALLLLGMGLLAVRKSRG